MEKTSYRCQPALQQFYNGGCFAFSTNGFFLACEHNDHFINIVDVDKASCIKSTDHQHGRVTNLLFGGLKDKFLFSSHGGGLIIIWNSSTLEIVRSWNLNVDKVSVVNSMACHPDGSMLATGGADGVVRVWNVHDTFCLHSIQCFSEVVSRVMFHKELLFSVSRDSADNATVEVWDLSMTSKNKHTATLDKNCNVTSFAVSEDGSTLLTAGTDKVVTLWDLHQYTSKGIVNTDQPVAALFVIAPDFASSLNLHRLIQQCSNTPAFYFVALSEEGIINIFSSEGGESLFKTDVSNDLIRIDDEDDSRGSFTYTVMLPSNQRLVCVAPDSHQFLFYSLKWIRDDSYPHFDRLESNLTKRLVGSNKEVVDMKFVDDNEELIALVTGLGEVRIYDCASMSCSYVLSDSSKTALCLDICTQGSLRTLIAAGCKDSSVLLWSLKDGAELTDLVTCSGAGEGHTGAVQAIAFSNSKGFYDFLIVSGSSDRTLKVWSQTGGVYDLVEKASVIAHDQGINYVAIDQNDHYVCSGSQEDCIACVWSLPDLKKVVTLKGHTSGVRSVEFSPVDEIVVTASDDKTIRTWNISDGSCLKTFQAHTSSVLRALFVARGTQIVSCGADGLVKLWTVTSQKCVATYADHFDPEDKVRAFAVGRKTEMLATGASNGVVKMWLDSSAADREAFFKVTEGGCRRWECIDRDILSSIFLLLDVSDVTEGVSRVCKGWRSLCRDPSLWKTIDLSTLKSYSSNPSRRYINRVARISMISLTFGGTFADTLIFPFNVPELDELLMCAANKMPNLKRLVQPVARLKRKAVCDAYRLWQNLESLTIPSYILSYVCQEEMSMAWIRELKIVVEESFWENDAGFLSKSFPKLSVLSFMPTLIHEDAVLTLLNNLPDLEVLNISHCDLFKGGNPDESYKMSMENCKQILAKASCLKDFLTNIDDLDSCDICRSMRGGGISITNMMTFEHLWRTDKVKSLEF